MTDRTEELRREWRARLARVLDSMIEPEPGEHEMDEAFGAPTPAESAVLEQEKLEVAELERKAQAEPAPAKGRYTRGMLNWIHRKSRGG